MNRIGRCIELDSSPRHFLINSPHPSSRTPEAMKQFQFFIIHKPERRRDPSRSAQGKLCCRFTIASKAQQHQQEEISPSRSRNVNLELIEFQKEFLLRGCFFVSRATTTTLVLRRFSSLNIVNAVAFCVCWDLGSTSELN